MINEVKQKFIITTSIVFIVVLFAVMIVLYAVMDRSFYTSAKTTAFSITNSIYIGMDEAIFDGADIGAFISKDPFIVDLFFQDEVKHQKALTNYLYTVGDIYHYDTVFLASFKTNAYYGKTGIVQSFTEGTQNDQWFFNKKSQSQPDKPFDILEAEDANGDQIFYLTYVIFQADGTPMGMIMLGMNYAETMARIYDNAEQLDSQIYLIAQDDLPQLDMGSDDNLSFLQDIDLNSVTQNAEFNFYTIGNQFVSIQYMTQMNRFLVITQNMSNHLLNVFVLTAAVVVVILIIVALIVMRIFSDSSKKLMQHASLDTLTGIMTRNSYDKRIEEALELCQNYQIPSTLIFIDIDHFKQVNDTQGHDVGDDVIKQVADLLKDSKRSEDTLFRWGGDEFAIIARCTIDHGLSLSKRILDGAKDIHWAKDQAITLSIGVSEIQGSDTKKECFNRVDEALYYAKEQGRNQICYL